MSSYDSSHSKVAVSPAVTVTSVRGRINPMDRAEQEEDGSSENFGAQVVQDSQRPPTLDKTEASKINLELIGSTFTDSQPVKT